jgi:hypothetical protein
MRDLARAVEERRGKVEQDRVDAVLVVEDCLQALALAERTLALAQSRIQKQNSAPENSNSQHRVLIGATSQARSELEAAELRLKQLDTALKELDALN